MGVATTAKECQLFLDKATEVSPKHPVVVSKYFENTKEIEVDAVAAKGEIIAMAVIEHVENAEFIPETRRSSFHRRERTLKQSARSKKSPLK